MSSDIIKIWIISPSYIIRTSLVSLLRKKYKGALFKESFDLHNIREEVLDNNCDVIIIDNGFFSSILTQKETAFVNAIKSLTNISLITFGNSDLSSSLLHSTINIYDSPDIIYQKINHILEINKNSENKLNSEELSEREKEVLVNVVKGFTNKQIADNMNLSVHTIISHRKNISRKLDIKSSSGLTIYAIINNLIDVNEINL
ncbi:MAG: LuxR C-terminal-related transcriptional regulator [Bacteroidales bacterium]|nr:LuxR C-terminal-related transcriptional regulator [Bacteroidales bacterium]